MIFGTHHSPGWRHPLVRSAPSGMTNPRHGYDPNQPRVPAGHRDGGQWTHYGDGRNGEVASTGTEGAVPPASPFSKFDGWSIEELMRGERNTQPLQDDRSDFGWLRGTTDGSDEERRTVEGRGVERTSDQRILSDAIPDNYWISWADYAAGHHWMAKEIYNRYNFSEATRKVFSDATSGPLARQARSEMKTFRHVYDNAHRDYSRAVEDLLLRYMNDKMISAQQVTPDQAREILRAIRQSDDLRIQRYLQMIKTLGRIFRLHGVRGNE
jgi:hypothetical protein